MTQRLRPLLGTFVSIEARADGEIIELAAIDEAFAAIERVGALLHPTSGSDLRRLRAARIGEPVQVEPWTYAVLRACRELHAQSGGLFDPCLPAWPGRMQDLELDDGGAQIVKRADFALDLGGIAKGFAVDRAIEALRPLGCTSGLVNAGGDVRAFGTMSREIVLRLPFGRAHALQLDDEAVAVSEPKSERSPAEHRGFYRGDTGEQVIGRWVAVIAPTATLADGLAKCAMLCSPEVAAGLLARHGARALFDAEVP
jgi:thiamine biosynthesis lipoprotein